MLYIALKHNFNTLVPEKTLVIPNKCSVFLANLRISSFFVCSGDNWPQWNNLRVESTSHGA